MKKIYLLLIAVIAHGMLLAQFAGIQNNEEQPLHDGYLRGLSMVGWLARRVRVERKRGAWYHPPREESTLYA